MRVLCAIPHFVRPETSVPDTPRYDSHAGDTTSRIAAVTACLTALHQNFNVRPTFINQGRSTAREFPPAVAVHLDIVICTTRDCHLLDQLPVEPRYYIHIPSNCEPLLLGFTCHDALRERLGQYDYYCYLEDDLILHDPWLFHKLNWFNQSSGDDKLLQANRYECGLNHLIAKIYVDGDLAERVTAPFQDTRDTAPLAGEVLGLQLLFQRTLNPHSGCFFLNARQMRHWAQQPYFLDRDCRFVGPLESAATLGILRTFKIYRPARANADFLEIQHYGTGYLKRLCKEEHARAE